MFSCTPSLYLWGKKKKGRLSSVTSEYRTDVSVNTWLKQHPASCVFDGPKPFEQMCFFNVEKMWRTAWCIDASRDVWTCRECTARKELWFHTIIRHRWVSLESGRRKCPRPNWCQVFIWLCSSLYSEVHLWQMAECSIWNPSMICYYGYFSLSDLNLAHIRKLVCA